MVGANCVRPPNNPPPTFRIMLETPSLYTKEALKEVESAWHNESILTVGTGVPDCPNMVSVKVSVVF